MSSTSTQVALSPTDAKTPKWSPNALCSDAPVSNRTLLGTLAGVAVLYALLWSPNYYPLSDSSLYLTMARGLARGEGLEYIRQVHRSIRPITPLVLSWILRAGGGIGAMHAVMIVLMLVSFVLMYLTVRRWFNDRLAYWLTLLTTLSWWVYANAFTIMTEPPFLVFLWGSLLALSYVHDAPRKRRWALVLAGAILLAGAWGNRVAAILFVPGIVLALWLSCRDVASRRERLGWAAIFGAVFLLLLADYRRPVARPAGATTRESISADGLGLADVGESDPSKIAEAGYRWNVLVGVQHPAIQLPVSGGRWPLEVLAAGMVFPFGSKSPLLGALGAAMGLAGLALLIIGAVRMARSGCWWPVMLLTYFVPLWVMWGTRVKPRYMIPVAPVMFVLLWTGASVIVGWLRRNRAGGRAAGYRLGGRIGLATMLFLSISLNGFAYGVEVYIRRFNPYDFYDQARRGAFAELVDICAYLRNNTPPGTDVWLNRGASRRIVGLLSGREAMTPKREVGLTNASDGRQFAKLIPRIKGRYLIALYEQYKWPPFHFPLAQPAPDGAPPRWWQLFAYDDATKTFKPVHVPRDRTTVRQEFLKP